MPFCHSNISIFLIARTLLKEFVLSIIYNCVWFVYQWSLAQFHNSGSGFQSKKSKKLNSGNSWVGEEGEKGRGKRGEEGWLEIRGGRLIKAL